jgi:hypothetical protein
MNFFTETKTVIYKLWWLWLWLLALLACLVVWQYFDEKIEQLIQTPFAFLPI